MNLGKGNTMLSYAFVDLQKPSTVCPHRWALRTADVIGVVGVGSNGEDFARDYIHCTSEIQEEAVKLLISTATLHEKRLSLARWLTHETNSMLAYMAESRCLLETTGSSLFNPLRISILFFRHLFPFRNVHLG